MVDWQARAEAVRAADGETWDRLSAAYDTDWKAAYCTAFRAAAKARGWSDENIESGWLDDMPTHACIAHAWEGTDPTQIAATDVIECEREAANG